MYNVLALLPILFFINLIEENDFLTAEEEKDKEGDGEGEGGKTKKKKRDNESKKKKKKKGPIYVFTLAILTKIYIPHQMDRMLTE